MRVDMIMPQMGESIAEAKVSKWRKKIGDAVKKDEVILDISTDKVDSEIPAPAAGTLVELLANEGDVVPVKTKIAIIDTEGGAAAPTPVAPKAEKVAAPTPTPVAPTSPPASRSVAASSNGHATAAAGTDADRYYSPLVKSLAEKHQISSADLANIQGTGQGGRVTKQDLLAFAEGRGHGAAPATRTAAPAPAVAAAMPSSPPTPAPRTAAPAPAAKSSAQAISDWGDDGTKVVPMDNMRQVIAEHMVRSKRTSPHVYSIQEIDCSYVARWREKKKAPFQAQEGFNLSFMPFFMEAVVKALQAFPIVNSSVDGNKVIYKRHINLGVAVALGNTGLIVPVIKHAEEKNFVGLARSLNDLSARARNKKLMPDDVMGGTFTLTNVGSFGTVIGNPIINQPQVAILALGVIKKRPVVVDDMIAIREISYLTLSYDHRIIDGAIGGQFLAMIRDHLEGWNAEREL